LIAARYAALTGIRSAASLAPTSVARVGRPRWSPALVALTACVRGRTGSIRWCQPSPA